MSDLPLDVEAVLWAGGCNEGCDGCPPPNDCPINAIESPCWLISTLRAQAEEIERLEDYAEGLKLGASIVREERDRYKDALEDACLNIADNNRRENVQNGSPGESGVWFIEDAERILDFYLKAAEEATRDE